MPSIQQMLVSKWTFSKPAALRRSISACRRRTSSWSCSTRLIPAMLSPPSMRVAISRRRGHVIAAVKACAAGAAPRFD